MLNHLSTSLLGISLTYTVCSKLVKAFVPVAPMLCNNLSYSFAIAYLAAMPDTESI